MQAPSSTSEAVQDRRSSLTQDLLDRRFPQYLAVYIGGSWGVIEFFAFLEDRFLLSPHWTNLVLLALVLLLPSVALFIYFHGRKGADAWHRVEKVGIPTNLAIALVVLFGAFSGKDLGAVTTTVTVADEDGNAVERVMPKAEFRKTVALFTPLADSTDADVAWLGHGVYNGLLNDLWQDVFLNLRASVQFRSEIRDAGFTSDAAMPRALKRRIASDMNVPYFVDGEVGREGEEFQLTLTLNDAARGRVVQERVHRGADLFAVIDSAAVQLRRDLDLPQRHLEDTPDLPVTEHTTGSTVALRHVAEASRALWVDDDYEAARTSLEAAIAEDGTFAYAAYTLYNVLIQMSDVPAAVEALQVAMDNLYRLPERTHYAVKGEWYAIRQDFPRMFGVYEMWAELYPDDVTAQATVAQMHLFREDREAAIEALERVLELDPTRVEILPQIGRIYEELGQPDLARDYYERHLEAVPEDAGSLRSLAALSRRAGEHDAARAFYERALLLEPADVSLMAAIASLDMALGRFDDARTGYEGALASARNPEQRHTALAALVTYHRLRGELDRALEYHELAIAEAAGFMPPIARIQSRLLSLDLYVHVGRAGEALELLETLSEQLQPPLDAVVSIGRMNVHEALDEPEKLEAAVADGVAMLEATGMNVLRKHVDYFTGRMHEMRGEWSEALTAYERELASAPTDTGIPAQMARCQRELGNLREAEELFLRTLAVTPYDGRTNYEIALLYERMGRTADAVEHLERALAVWAPADDDFPWARLAREKLAALGA